MFSINFTITNTKRCFRLHYNADMVICLLIEKKSLNLNPKMKRLTSPLNLVLSVYLMDVVLPSLEKYVSADYYSIDKSDILNNHGYLTTKNHIKKCSALSNKCLLYY